MSFKESFDKKIYCHLPHVEFEVKRTLKEVEKGINGIKWGLMWIKFRLEYFYPVYFSDQNECNGEIELRYKNHKGEMV